MAKYPFPTVCSIVLVCLVLFATAGSPAELPGKINYQARLTDTDSGERLEGSYDLEFRLYDSATEGDLLWSETQSVDIDSLGIISVILGSETEIDLSFDRPVWLEVVVAGEVLTPRRELVSVPYAFRSRRSGDADSLGGVHSGDYVAQGETGGVTSDMIEDGPGSGLDADLLDGLSSEAFADSGHNHDSRYYKQEELNTAGSINDSGNPVDWTRLKGVPSGFADGVDNEGPGDGHSLDADDGNPIDALYVDSDGDVGIGTTGPAEALHIRGSNPVLLVDASGGDSEIQLKSSDDGSADVWTIYKDSATDDLRFSQNGDKVTIDNSTGNVGIGTATPTEGKLQVEAAGQAVYTKSSGDRGIFAVVDTAVGGELPAVIVGTSTTIDGVHGYSAKGSGVGGYSNTVHSAAIKGVNWGGGIGVAGHTGSSVHPGVYASQSADDGIAMEALAWYDHGIGVFGHQTGYSKDDIAMWYQPGGYFCGRNGVIGLTKETGGYAVFGYALNASAFAGQFQSQGHGVVVSTPLGKVALAVSGGSKSALVATADGARSLYCEEASEVWFSDYGFGRLEGGVAVVAIDPVFAQTVNLDQPYHVFLQAYGDADLYVASRSSKGFEVRLRDGDPSVEFSYRIMAKRVGFEKERLARAPWADNDANLFPGKEPRRQGEQ